PHREIHLLVACRGAGSHRRTDTIGPRGDDLWSGAVILESRELRPAELGIADHRSRGVDDGHAPTVTERAAGATGAAVGITARNPTRGHETCVACQLRAHLVGESRAQSIAGNENHRDDEYRDEPE